MQEGETETTVQRTTISNRLRRRSQIGPYGTVTLKFFTDQRFILQGRHDHHLFTLLPVGRGGHAVMVGQLQESITRRISAKLRPVLAG
jgi:hypothetical protein